MSSLTVLYPFPVCGHIRRELKGLCSLWSWPDLESRGGRTSACLNSRRHVCVKDTDARMQAFLSHPPSPSPSPLPLLPRQALTGGWLQCQPHRGMANPGPVISKLFIYTQKHYCCARKLGHNSKLHYKERQTFGVEKPKHKH